MSAFGTRPTNRFRAPPPLKRLEPLPRCPACGKRVMDERHAVHLHGALYHGHCTLYSRGRR